MNFILQFIPGEMSTHEISTIRKYIMLNGGEYKNSTISDLWSYQEQLVNGWVPVGSVEFVRKAFRVLGIEEPEFSPYPEVLQDYILRKIKKLNLSINEIITIEKPTFIKPVKLKLFNGFVLDTNKALQDYSEHDLEQITHIYSISPKTKKLEIYTSDIVEFLQEYRFYVSGSKILGVGRYDDAPEKDLSVNIGIVNLFISELNCDHPYTLDIGIIPSGMTDLVEVNDAWAIGLYGSALTEVEYAKFLSDRWNNIYKPRN